ncbi:MAG: hypothetical protein ACRDGA_03850 [Bacteroidota bacterium]
MKTTVCLKQAMACALLLMAAISSQSLAQVTVTISGVEAQVVQYDTGSATKFYSSYALHDIGRKDGAVQTLSPASKNDTWRTGIEFWLHGAAHDARDAAPVRIAFTHIPDAVEQTA